MNHPSTSAKHGLTASVSPNEENETSILVEKTYDQFVPALLASYATVGGLNNRDAHNMPSTRAIGQICHDLLQLLFPGFHDDDAVHHGTLAELTGERLSKVALRLE